MDDMYRQLFDELPCYVTAQDKEFRLIAANRRFREHFGMKEGGYCYEVYKQRKSKCPICPVEETFLDGQVHSNEEIVKRIGGDEISVIVYTAPIRDANGEITAAVEISADITDVKTLQQEFRTLFNITPCYISVQGRDLKIERANRRFKRDFGRGIGEECYRVYKHRTEPCATCAVAETFQDGRVHNSEEVVTSLKGKPINVLCHTAPIRNAMGEIVSVMEMSTNITELREVQSQLSSLGLLVGSVSHGIKGLLSGLEGGIYLLETGLSKNNQDRIDDGRGMIKRNAERIRNMIMNILYYAKEREVELQEIDLAEMVSSIGKMLETRARSLDVKITAESQEGTFEGDKLAIRSLLMNLVENSIEACRTNTKREDHEVTLSARSEAETVVFDVKDTGIGMDQQTREKAFSLFFSSKGAGGTGLGLFIANKIVTNHNGTITIDSSPGEGTQIQVRLPRQNPANNAEKND